MRGAALHLQSPPPLSAGKHGLARILISRRRQTRSQPSTAMPLPPTISIVMRSFNDATLIRETLRAVHDQDYAGGVELIHIDSGSTDGTVDIIRSFNPRRLIELKPGEYVPGRVLNQGMRESRGDWVVFLNSDAEPADASWLSRLLECAHNTPMAGAVFSRQLPRPDCNAVYAHDYERCFGPHRESADWEHFFSMVSCAVYRPAWNQEPFREDLQYAEDDEWSRRLRHHHWRIGFAADSCAIHSHNYTLRQAYRRCRGDSFAQAATRRSEPRPLGTFLHVIALGTLRDWVRDLRWCLHRSRLLAWPHASAVRLAQRLGKFQGLRQGWQHYHPTGAAS